MPLELVAPPNENVVSATGRDNDVVRDKAVAALDQIENAFGLSDSTAPGEEKADAEYIRERAVKRGRRREFALENRLYATIELGCLEARPQQCDSGTPRAIGETRRQILTLRDDYSRKGKIEERGENAIAMRGVE
jgi:hypothetical protein